MADTWRAHAGWGSGCSPQSTAHLGTAELIAAIQRIFSVCLATVMDGLPAESLVCTRQYAATLRISTLRSPHGQV
ncbi:MAG: hypothetical protein L0G56_01330, partial [Brevibacterium sp.]|nr:hypothetical protein [Brevibacterium sp.]